MCIDVAGNQKAVGVEKALPLREKRMVDRRRVITGMGSALASAVVGLAPRITLSQERPPLVPGLPEGVYDTAILDALPGKKPLIKLTYRPPNYETPVSSSKPRSRQTTPFSCAVTSRTSRKASRPRAGGCKSAAK